MNTFEKNAITVDIIETESSLNTNDINMRIDSH